jgi:predicted nucleic acid-binding protein
MRVLLDTNIIIYRENKSMTNYSICHLFRWLDKLKCDKFIHPYSKQEIANYKYEMPSEAMTLKLDAYEEMLSIAPLSEDFRNKFIQIDKSENDKIDTALLNEVYRGRVDFLITEDKKLIQKSKTVGIDNKVLSINAFITWVSAENPSLVEYKALAVEKIVIGTLDVNNNFFDSLRKSYNGFNEWFARKCNEEAYICFNDTKEILGFLYIKTEQPGENYTDISPKFSQKKRLKVATFKVVATGFRLGERFIKIILDNAIERNVEEIYVTLFEDSPELATLSELLNRWGFQYFGNKTSTGESVLVKQMKIYDYTKSVKQNFPSLLYKSKKIIMPIKAEYHTSLLPDSILRTENRVDFIGKEAHRYALQKVYISFASHQQLSPGDIVLFYRMGDGSSGKRYSSVLTSICIVEEDINSFSSKSDFLKECQNRTVFTKYDLDYFWNKNRYNISVLKFIFVKSLVKRPTLDYLWNSSILNFPNGPRQFTKISDSQFEMIMKEAQTDLSPYWR